MSEAKHREVRSIASNFQIRKESEDDLFIEGYFSVFDTNYNIFDGAVESIGRGAFDDIDGEDVRALVDHDTRIVIGRTKAGTLELKVDERGLWGRIKINPNDVDAMNIYERVKRGDVDQCSFGFDILSQTTEYLEDGTIHFIIEKVKLYEVSVVTFPAYSETSVEARKQDIATIEKRKAEIWKADMLKKLRGEN